MTMLVKVDRIQYGIGQGGFHAQQIRLVDLPQGVEVEPYRFVYDCGSDTGSLKPKQATPLQWAIEHFSQNRDSRRSSKLVVESLYLSHYQKDHIDGAKALAELVDLKEIVIPHLSRDQLAHLLAQQIASRQLSVLTTATSDYLDALNRAAGEGSLFGGIPTTRVAPGGEPPGNETRGSSGGEQSAQVDLDQGAYTLDHDLQKGAAWPHAHSRLLSVANKNTGVKSTLDIWELRVWSYAQSSALTTAVIEELKLLKDNQSNPALPNTVMGKVDLNELSWAIKNRIAIQDAYERALLSQQVRYASDHNVVSLCLHSGPTKRAALQGPWRRNGSHGSWLGTGDAMLERQHVWAAFYQHFNQGGRDRTLQWQTVLMPHHGSGSGGNFNVGLLQGPVCYAVYSAGAFNKYGHPSWSVMQAAADAGVLNVVITEYSRIGFVEHRSYSVP